VASAERRRRFGIEARAASSLNHPNIGTIYDIGEREGQPFIAMEWIDGAAVSDAVPPGGMSVDRALTLARQIAGGLAAAHRAGIVHRDVKPANILLTKDGVAKIVDFGLAKVLAAGGDGEVAAPVAGGTAPEPPDNRDAARPTLASRQIGTPGYAPPEQIEGRPLDARTDVFGLGCVIYELLCGCRAFDGGPGRSPVEAVLEGRPVPLRTRRPDVPRRLESIVARALAAQPSARYASAVELLADLDAAAGERAARQVPLGAALRRRAVAIVSVVLLAAAATGGWWAWRRNARETWVRGSAIPQAKAMLAASDLNAFAALRLLRQAEALTPDDPQLQEALEEATASVEVSTEPPGAEIFVRDYRDPPDQWELLGQSPLEARVPAGLGGFVWRVSKEGFIPLVRVGTAALRRQAFTLVPSAGAPSDMVPVPGGSVELFSSRVRLDPFWIDATEVTNRDFLEFVRHGGYDRAEFWVDAPPPGAGRHFVDASGLPGPSTWTGGRPPRGQDDHPVAGVNSYEASAYCRSLGKDLPTAFHWYHAASPAATTQWASLGNFLSAGTSPVGGALRLNMFGTLDMAGNVREWTRTEARQGFLYSLGGSYIDPSYRFWNHWAEAADAREPHIGFRCAKYTVPLDRTVTSPVPVPLRDYRLERPTGDGVYAVLASLYDYDPALPLDAAVESTDDSSALYRLQRVRFAAAYGAERVRAFLLLPRNSRPPYQVVVWYPGGGVFAPGPFVIDAELPMLRFIVRSGRAVFFPEYKGSFTRFFGVYPRDPEGWRQILVYSAKDLRRALDYVEERPDLDAGRVAYYGLSLGAAAAGIMTAVEPRFKASLLVAGGLYSLKRPPEADVINFLPRVRVPTLMINGRHDYFFPVDTSQEPMFRLLGTGQKEHVLFESGHSPSETGEVQRRLLEWLDRYLGPVALDAAPPSGGSASHAP
jgi:dienelactone hydrolase